MKSGIYRIINSENGHCYYGNSLDMQRRCGQHFRALRNGKHWNQYLQNAFIKYGEAAFKFEEVCFCAAEHLHKLEAVFIDRAVAPYNIRIETGTLFRHSEETKHKISLANTGNSRPDLAKFNALPETRALRSKMRSGKKSGPWTKERCAAASLSRRGKPKPWQIAGKQSEATKQKRRETWARKRGKKQSAETIRKRKETIARNREQKCENYSKVK